MIAVLFDGGPHPFRSDLLRWMSDSSRYTTFVETYRDKIRKKVRVSKDPDSRLDLKAELFVACCLLRDRRLELEYEKFASARRRGPDFTVTYRSNLVFNVEVSRLHGDKGTTTARFYRTLFAKLGQMQPGVPNVLAVHARPEHAGEFDLDSTFQQLKIRVDRRDPEFFTGSSYSSPADFYKDFLRLSGVFVWGVQYWINKQARLALPEKVFRLVHVLSGSAGAETDPA